MDAPRQILEVVGAVIRQGDRYLVGQRPPGKAQAGLWEFVGGKIEPGETPREALARECREELALELRNVRESGSVTHEYPEKTVHLTLFACEPAAGSVPRACEHQAIRWVTRAEMADLPFCAADRELIARLFGHAGGGGELVDPPGLEPRTKGL